jgi:hypothetical protein
LEHPIMTTHDTKPLTYGALPEPIPDTVLPSGARILHRQPQIACSNGCHGEYSANPGDYWNYPKDAPIVCDDCGEPMIVVHERTYHVPADRLAEWETIIDSFWIGRRDDE